MKTFIIGFISKGERGVVAVNAISEEEARECFNEWDYDVVIDYVVYIDLSYDGVQWTDPEFLKKYLSA